MGRNARQRLLEASTINFPKPITLEETRDLMRYLAKELPCDMEFEPTLTRELYRNSTGNIEEKAGVAKFECRLKRNETFDCFKGLVAEEDYTKLKSMIVLLPKYYRSLRSYGDRVKLWNDTRDCVERYFRTSD